MNKKILKKGNQIIDVTNWENQEELIKQRLARGWRIEETKTVSSEEASILESTDVKELKSELKKAKEEVEVYKNELEEVLNSSNSSYKDNDEKVEKIEDAFNFLKEQNSVIEKSYSETFSIVFKMEKVLKDNKKNDAQKLNFLNGFINELKKIFEEERSSKK